jgi:hypothetical protein
VSERHTYPGRPNWCPGAIRGPGRRVRHESPVPTADIVQSHGGVLVGAAGLCSSCSALEELDREQRRAAPEEATPRRRGRA